MEAPGARTTLLITAAIVMICLAMAAYEVLVTAALFSALKLPVPLAEVVAEALKAWIPWLLGAPIVAILNVRFRVVASAWWQVAGAQLVACAAIVGLNLLGLAVLKPAMADPFQLVVPETAGQGSHPAGSASALHAPASDDEGFAKSGGDVPGQEGRSSQRGDAHPLPDPEGRDIGITPIPSPPWFVVVFSLVIVYLFLAVSVQALLAFGEVRRREKFEAELRAAAASSQLAALRMQIKPHFLFNALNGVSATMRDDIELARRMLSDLSTLLRSSFIDTDRHEVPLQEELDFSMRYLAIERTRFGDRLSVEVDASPEARLGGVPWLFLQPLVENFVVHAVERSRRTCRLVILAELVRETLRVVVSDDGPGPPPGGRLGVGLQNLRERFAQLYARDGTVTSGGRADGGFRVELSLPYRPCPSAGGASNA